MAMVLGHIRLRRCTYWPLHRCRCGSLPRGRAATRAQRLLLVLDEHGLLSFGVGGGPSLGQLDGEAIHRPQPICAEADG